MPIYTSRDHMTLPNHCQPMSDQCQPLPLHDTSSANKYISTLQLIDPKYSMTLCLELGDRRSDVLSAREVSMKASDARKSKSLFPCIILQPPMLRCH